MDSKESIIVEDRRFKQCTKEMWLVLGLFVINLIVVGIPAIALGLNKPSADVTFILGFPAWFFWGGIVGSLIICILPLFMVKFFFKDMSIEAEEEDGEVDY
ncbi:DUF997 family protein [Fredinandcohnia salidurans]|uniref:DUF997 family protein n=1 Tax=Fredinandcohnia salidurans TaxID=2595041 RepID=A0ABW4MQ65_9BACI|nr:YhdT family protein [Fredinandcohnia onubensis]